MTIRDLIIWLTCAAAYLALTRATTPTSLSLLPAWLPALYSAYFGLAGTCLARVLAIRFARRKERTPASSIEPGLLLGSSVAILLIADLVPLLCAIGSTSLTPRMETLLTCIPAVVFATASFAGRGARNWRSLFLLLCGLEILRLSGLMRSLLWGNSPSTTFQTFMVGYYPFIRATLALGWISFELSQDRISRTIRNVWHYLGLAVGVIWLMLPVLLNHRS